MDDRFGLSFLSRALTATDVWLAVAYIVSMIAAVAFRPQQIENPAMFRMSYLTFALSLIVPGLADGIVLLMSMDNPGPLRGGGGMGIALLSPLCAILGKVLFAVSVVCALACFRIGRVWQPPPREGA